MIRAVLAALALACLVAAGATAQVGQIPAWPPVQKGVAAGGGIAFISAADLTDNGGTGAFSKAYTSGGGTLIIGVNGDVVTGVDNIGTTDVKYNSVSCTFDRKQTPTDATARFQYFYHCLTSASGAHNVDITCAGIACTHYILAGVAEYSGVTGVDFNGVSQDNNASPSSLTTSLTTVADNSWVVLLEAGYEANAAPGAGTGATRRTFNAAFGNWGLFDSGGPVHPAGSYSMTTTYPSASTAGMDHLLVSFKP